MGFYIGGGDREEPTRKHKFVSDGLEPGDFFSGVTILDDSGVCPVCKGTGANPASDNLNWLPCGACDGTGVKH